MDSLLKILKLRGWDVLHSGIDSSRFTTKLPSQYTMLPAAFTQWLDSFDVCTNVAQTSWFLSRQDYAGSTDTEFRWNEIQLMSLEACETELEKDKVNSFWHSHFPIALAVHSSYDYLAISLVASSFGAVVHGSGPEWESISILAPSFTDFMAQFESAVISKNPDWPYALFL